MSRVPSRAARLILTITVMLCSLAVGTALAGNAVGSVNFTLGAKRLSSDWFPSTPRTTAFGETLVTKSLQPALGIEVAWGHTGWPVMLAVDVLHSYDDGVQRYRENPLINLPLTDVRRRVSTLEIGVGARRTWSVKGLSPCLGAGVSWMRANRVSQMIDPGQGAYGTPGPEVSGRHSAKGFWVSGALYRRLGPRFQMGLTGRYSKAKMSFPELGLVRGAQGGYYFVSAPAGNKIEAGGRHIGLLLGWSFPGRK